MEEYIIEWSDESKQIGVFEIDNEVVNTIDDYMDRLSAINKKIIDKGKLVNELFEEFKIKFPNIGSLKRIIAYGDVEDISVSALKRFIEVRDIQFKDVNKYEYKRAFRCFNQSDKDTTKPITVNDGFTYGNLILHEDYHSSWNCLMQHLNHPKLVIIYKKEE